VKRLNLKRFHRVWIGKPHKHKPNSEIGKARISLVKKGLPVVSRKTIEAIQHVYAGEKWGRQLGETRDTLMQENPHMVKFIESQVGKFPREFHNAIFEVVIGTLSVLEHQTMVEQTATGRIKIRKGKRDSVE
jgi:hypothetical protein